MRRLLYIPALLIAVSSVPARADRPLTDDERAKVTAALTAQGCSGGKQTFDDGYFDIDDAKCDDGRIYDFKFDSTYKLIEKDLEK